ncbi:MAG: adenylosuccinate lyase, partial [Bacilli bacterium]
FGNIVKNLTVFPENMKRNMTRTYGLIYSQRVMLTLIDKGMSREEAYDIVQPKTMEAWEKGVQFKELVESEPRITNVLTQEEIDSLFDPSYHASQVDTVFGRLGLND